MEGKEQKYTVEVAYDKLSALCAVREYCCDDMMRKMSKWNIPPEEAEKVIAKLVKNQFIDEERYARAFARDKFRYNHWGSVRIQMELKRRHIASRHIEEGLTELDDEDSIEALRNILKKKRPSVKGKNEYEIRGKLIRFALGRGFSMDDVIKVVGSLDECID